MTAEEGDPILQEQAATRILVGGARILAHGSDLASGLDEIVAITAEAVGAASAAVVIPGPDGPLEVVAVYGLDTAARAALVAACQNPDHPIARTFRDRTPTFDVLPTQPGAPALRSQLRFPSAATGRTPSSASSRSRTTDRSKRTCVRSSWLPAISPPSRSTASAPTDGRPGGPVRGGAT